MVSVVIPFVVVVVWAFEQLKSIGMQCKNEMNYSNSKLTEEQKKALFIPDQPGQPYKL